MCHFYAAMPSSLIAALASWGAALALGPASVMALLASRLRFAFRRAVLTAASARVMGCLAPPPPPKQLQTPSQVALVREMKGTQNYS